MISNGQMPGIPMPEDQNLFEKIEGKGLTKADMGLRPQHIKYSFTPQDGYFRSIVYSYESIGNKSVISADCGEYQLRMIAPNGLKVRIDQEIYINLMVDHSMYLDPQTKDYFCRYNEEAIKAFVAGQEVE